MNIISILLAFVAFGFLIAVHEFGHFIAAKRSGIRVNEFWIGMGPIVLSKDWHGTKYCLRLLPLGGACVMEGEDGDYRGTESEHSDIGVDVDMHGTKSFQAVSMPRRILTVAAGALMNFLAGFLIILAVLAFSSDIASFRTTTIESFFDGFQYQGDAMLQPGDQILKIDGYRILQTGDITTGFSRGAADGKYDITVKRSGNKLLLRDLPLTADFTDDKGRQLFGISFASEPKNAATLVKNAFYQSVNFGRMIWDSLVMLVRGQVGMDQLSGPLGVGDVLAKTVQSSFMDFLSLVAFISINLGVMNLLPLPALDGGRLVFLLLECVRGKPIPPKYEGYVHAAGLALLLMLMVYVTGKDILNIITRMLKG